MRLQLAKHFDWDSAICPFDIPILDIFLYNNIVIEVKADLFDNFILCVDEVGGDGLVFSFMCFIDGGVVDVLIFVVLFFLMVVFH